MSGELEIPLGKGNWWDHIIDGPCHEKPEYKYGRDKHS
jgi:hypothetical protein